MTNHTLTSTLLRMGCSAPCESYLTCDSPCKAGTLATLCRKAMLHEGMSLGAALRVAYAIGMDGGYPMADPQKDADFLDLMDATGPFSSPAMEAAFYDSIP